MKLAFNKMEGKLLEIYSNGSLTQFDVGKLVAEDNSWIILKLYDDYGFYDGYMLLFKDDIRKINYETQYLSLLKLHENNKKVLFWDKRNECCLLENVIQTVKREKVLCFSTEADDTLYGSIEENKDNILVIKSYTDNGESDGYTIIEKEIIESIQIDSKLCLNIEKNISIGMK